MAQIHIKHSSSNPGNGLSIKKDVILPTSELEPQGALLFKGKRLLELVKGVAVRVLDIDRGEILPQLELELLGKQAGRRRSYLKLSSRMK